MDIVTVIISVVLICLPLIPLLVELIKYIKKYVAEKNWRKLLDLTLSLIKEAEQLYSSGADREDYVVGIVLTTAAEIGYAITEDEVRKIIREIIDVTKSVNAKEEELSIEEATCESMD